MILRLGRPSRLPVPRSAEIIFRTLFGGKSCKTQFRTGEKPIRLIFALQTPDHRASECENHFSHAEMAWSFIMA